VDGEEPSKVVPVMDARRRGRHRLQRLWSLSLPIPIRTGRSGICC